MRIPAAVALLTVVAATLSAQTTAHAVQLFQAADWAGARAELSAVVKRDAADARAHYYLGRIAMLDDELDIAAEHFERAVKGDDKVAEYHVWYGNALRQQTTRASMFSQATLARAMLAEFERAVALDGNNVDARDPLVDFYAMVPAMMGGSVDKAREHAQAIARVDAMRGHLALARLATLTKDSAGAGREASAAIASAPDSIRAYVALANLHITAKRWPEAFAAIDRYTARHPDDVHAANAVARIAIASGQRLERGEQAIRSYIAKPPREAGSAALSLAYMRLGQILKLEGKTGEARAALEQAVRIDPRNEDAKKVIAP